MPERLLDLTLVGDSLEVGAEYHPEHGVVTILLSSPEQSTALNLEPEKGELNKFAEAVKKIESSYSKK
ncbi:MAG: hypothetical protein ACLFVS_03570 [Candidatus Acetothermia bacterium]|nr:hypothetical protein [Candidatus Bipolaricaulota bacterium]